MKVTKTDIVRHVVKVGIDVYPPIAITTNRTRLNVFFEKARAEHPDLFARLVSGENEFRLSRQYTIAALGKIEFPTFELTARGPVISVPIQIEELPSTGFEENYVDKLSSVRELFFRAFPDTKIMRFGFVREVIFFTSATSAVGILGPPTEMQGASLSGGNLVLGFNDDACNIRVTLTPVTGSRRTQLGAVGMSVDEELGRGLSLVLDVNNKEARPLESADILAVQERAESLWPDATINLIEERGG